MKHNGNLLAGTIEVDECYCGGKERNKHARKRQKSGRGIVGKQPVIGMRQREDGIVLAHPIKAPTRRQLHTAIA